MPHEAMLAQNKSKNEFRFLDALATFQVFRSWWGALAAD